MTRDPSHPESWDALLDLTELDGMKAFNAGEDQDEGMYPHNPELAKAFARGYSRAKAKYEQGSERARMEAYAAAQERLMEQCRAKKAQPSPQSPEDTNG